MKHIILAFCFSFIISSAFSQSIKTPKFSKEKYQHKKRVFNIIGYSLLGTSAFLFIKGSVLAKRQRANSPDAFLNLDGLGESIMGGVAGVASVPFFLIAAHYKNKMASFSFKTDQTFILQQNNLVQSAQPTITLKLNF
jgi:hypothetical protein